MTVEPFPTSVHPECPDPARLGPDPAQGLLRARAARVAADRAARDDRWRGGFTRRRFLAGVGAAGVAALGSQLVTARASFGQSADGTLVVVFLRGGMDGLAALVPAGDAHLAMMRPDIGVPDGALLQLDRGFGLHPALAPLHELWARNQFTAVPAVSTPDISRSHFQAQDCLERGGSSAGTAEGWLDRVLDAMGPGTTFRALSAGTTVARALAGDQPSLALRSVEAFTLHAGDGPLRTRTVEALTTLYTGFDHPLAADVASTMEGLDTAALMAASGYEAAAAYPDGEFADHMSEVARLIKAGVGLRVACVDVGGWDMHTGIGRVDDGNMARQLTSLGETLGAFATDLGGAFDRVNVVVMTEFGRRVEQNANGGTDHGHGAAVLLLGGGLAGGTVHGAWAGLAPDQLDQGDVPGWNDYRDVLAEVVTARLGVGAGALPAIFPGHQFRPLGVMA
ncbi:MAG: DUF1501 domain-containing protein [Acidimicrobiales bacterium]|nr:DUF1501 domain-containing protein [Acidimicrobiales bacterium]